VGPLSQSWGQTDDSKRFFEKKREMPFVSKKNIIFTNELETLK